MGIVGQNEQGSWLPGSPVKSIAFPQKLKLMSYFSKEIIMNR
jgi:hypothetical protein